MKQPQLPPTLLALLLRFRLRTLRRPGGGKAVLKCGPYVV